VVIEAFACGLPADYLAAMASQKSKWVNLEYLSAEPWVGDFHAKPSPQTNGLIRHFYFPGFTEATGGLIREAGIATQLQAHINPRPQAGLAMTWLMSFVSLVRCLVVSPEGARQRGRGAAKVDLDVAPLSNLSPASGREAFTAGEFVASSSVRPEPVEGQIALKISLFCYPHAPIQALLDTFAESTQVINCYIPTSSILPQIADFFGVETIGVGDYLSRENLHVHILPFLSQADYDQLLRDCDLNFVRGEDSWVRAIWAGKPFIWQPYVQDEDAHIKKLEAFLAFFYANLDEKDMLCKAHGYWAAGQMPNDVLNAYLAQLATIKTYTLQQSKQLAQQTDLATKLVNFCNKPVFTK
jgi:hypothetical protein